MDAARDTVISARRSGWEAGAVSTPPEPRPGDRASAAARAAAAALCAVLGQLRTNKKLSYDTLGQTPGLSRGTALNYITKPAHRRDAQTLELLLTALGASARSGRSVCSCTGTRCPSRWMRPRSAGRRGPGRRIAGVADGRVHRARGDRAHRDRPPP